jgi:hypothetical protein
MFPRDPKELVQVLRRLVDNRVTEHRRFDFKEELPGGRDEDRREFLADISSFANSFGGDIVYGIKEERDADGKRTGYPEAVTGLADNIDEAKLRLENMARDGLDPRLPANGIEFQEIADGTFPRGPVIVARIRRSFAAPHMVTYRGLSRFFARTGTGKHQMDVNEIRSAFLGSHDLVTRVHEFHRKRIALIASGGAPMNLGKPGSPFLAVHIVPLLADPLVQCDTAVASEGLAFRTLFGHGDRSRWNLDGRVLYTEYKVGEPVPGYVQVFRDGAVEMVDLSALANGSQLHAQAIEVEIVKTLGQNTRKVRSAQVDDPLVVIVTLSGIRGFSIVAPNVYWGMGEAPLCVDRNEVVLPETLIEGDFEVDRFKSTFDAFWQSGGWPSSPSFDDAGHWKNPR